MIKDDELNINEVSLENVPNEKIEAVEMAKKMIKKYVADRFTGKIDISKFEDILEQINVKYYYENDIKGGNYKPLGPSRGIYINTYNKERIIINGRNYYT